MVYYPVYLDIRGRRCIVIGGGRVAESKVQSLLEAKVQVTIVSPHLSPPLKHLAETNRIAYVARSYQRGDLTGAFLAVSAVNNRAVNEQVWQEAVEREIMVNVVDDLLHCNFITPAIVRRGDLTIAISTGGKAPALAARLRQQLEVAIGDEYIRFLELVGGMRPYVAARHPSFEQRKERWYRLIDSDVFDLLRRGDEPEARRRIAEILDIAPVEL